MNELVKNAYTIYKSGDLPKYVNICYENIPLLLEEFSKINKIEYEESKDSLSEHIDKLYEIDAISFLRMALIKLMIDSCKIVLTGIEEMNIINPKFDPHSIYYYIFSAENAEMIKLFQVYITFFYLQALFSKYEYACFDFEYTLQQNKLTQIAFESAESPFVMTWITNINEFAEEDRQRYIDLLFLNENITKILHGGDSLDMPFIHNILFGGSNELFKKFVFQCVDTRFPCEYYKIANNELANKCSIYDALLYFGVITQEQYARHEQNVVNMGPSSDISWNIHLLGKAQTLYAIYDVLYLKQFYLKMILLAQSLVSDEYKEGQKVLYTGLLKELVNFVYFERHEISQIGATCKAEIDPINNFMIRKSRSGKTVNLTLITIFNGVIKGIIMPNPLYELDKLMSVNWFKTPLTNIFKKIVYSLLTVRYEIYKDKMTRYDTKLGIKNLMDFFEPDFPNMKKMIEQFVNISSTKINDFIEK